MSQISGALRIRGIFHSADRGDWNPANWKQELSMKVERPPMALFWIWDLEVWKLFPPSLQLRRTGRISDFVLRV